VPDFLIARRFIDEGDDPDLGETPNEDLADLGNVLLVFRSAPTLRAARYTSQTRKDLRAIA
jgi:hypothetical protein